MCIRDRSSVCAGSAAESPKLSCNSYIILKRSSSCLLYTSRNGSCRGGWSFSHHGRIWQAAASLMRRRGMWIRFWPGNIWTMPSRLMHQDRIWRIRWSHRFLVTWQDSRRDVYKRQDIQDMELTDALQSLMALFAEHISSLSADITDVIKSKVTELSLIHI